MGHMEEEHLVPMQLCIWTSNMIRVPEKVGELAIQYY